MPRQAREAPWVGGVQKVTIPVPSSFSKQLTFINIFINLIFLCCLKFYIDFFSIIVYSTDVDDGRALSLGRIGSSSSAFQVLTVGGVCKVPSTFDYSVIIMGSETVAFLLGFH